MKNHTYDPNICQITMSLKILSLLLILTRFQAYQSNSVLLEDEYSNVSHSVSLSLQPQVHVQQFSPFPLDQSGSQIEVDFVSLTVMKHCCTSGPSVGTGLLPLSGFLGCDRRQVWVECGHRRKVQV